MRVPMFTSMKSVLLAAVVALAVSATPIQALAQPSSTPAQPTSSPVKPTSTPAPETCHSQTGVKSFVTCTSGPKKPTFRVALTGDSHSFQYETAILALAKKFRWSLTFVAKSGCPVVDPSMYPANMRKPNCQWWNAQRENYFNKVRPFDLVINSNSAFITHNKTNIGASYASAVKKITDRGSTVMLIRDNPKGISGVESCSKAKLVSGRCNSTREKALLPLDPLPDAVADNGQVIVADLTDAYCDATTCFAFRYGLKVYRDRSHISVAWAAHLQKRIAAAIPAEFKPSR